MIKAPRTLGKQELKINIVAPPKSDGWILRRWAERWAEFLPADISQSPSNKHDVNFYVNYALYNKGSRGLDVAYFTHKEGGELGVKFDSVAVDCELCIAQCKTTQDVILNESNNTLESDDIPIVYPGLDIEFNKQEKIVGVIGRDYASGRKRFSWLDTIEIPGIYIKQYDNIEYKEMPRVYREIDFLLVTSDKEGGPMPVAEAIGMGVPVIMPEGVGWYSEVPCYTYKDLYELGKILKGLATWQTHEESASGLKNAFELKL